jgi:hypothetical protein
VADERSRLEDVIRELNTTWSRELGLRLELVQWETHAYPDFGDDAQAVINNQIPDDFDIFIGIMWCRFGTPTARAESGTLEEFKRAKSRHDTDPNSVGLMMYFKDEPIPPSKLDIEQLATVANFRKSLGNEGALYWIFKDIDEFEKLLRMHLTRRVQAWRPQEPLAPTLPSSSPAYTAKLTGTDEDDLGLIDLIEIFEDEFAELTDIATRIAHATEDVGKKMAERANETNDLKAVTVGPVNKQAARKVISKAARDMDQFVQRMDAEIPLFATHLENGMNAFIRAAALSDEFKSGENDAGEAQQSLDGITTLHATLSEIEAPITTFQSAVSTLPRMTSELNRSKRKVVDVLQRFIDELHKAQNLTREAEAVVKAVVNAQSPQLDGN